MKVLLDQLEPGETLEHLIFVKSGNQTFELLLTDQALFVPVVPGLFFRLEQLMEKTSPDVADLAFGNTEPSPSKVLRRIELESIRRVLVNPYRAWRQAVAIWVGCGVFALTNFPYVLVAILIFLPLVDETLEILVQDDMVAQWEPPIALGRRHIEATNSVGQLVTHWALRHDLKVESPFQDPQFFPPSGDVRTNRFLLNKLLPRERRLSFEIPGEELFRTRTWSILLGTGLTVTIAFLYQFFPDAAPFQPDNFQYFIWLAPTLSMGWDLLRSNR
jgi:hypothetical protein